MDSYIEIVGATFFSFLALLVAIALVGPYIIVWLLTIVPVYFAGWFSHKLYSQDVGDEYDYEFVEDYTESDDIEIDDPDTNKYNLKVKDMSKHG